MIAKVNSIGLHGIEGYGIGVEIDVGSGLPQWEIVGLPDAAVKESKERIRSAIKNSSFFMPSKRMVINLAPADIKKEGAYLDFPIAVGLLIGTGQLFVPTLSDCVFMGELSLDGTLRKIRGALPMAVTAYQMGYKRIFLPLENAEEAAVVEGIEVYGVKDIVSLKAHLDGSEKIEQTVVDVDGIFKSAASYSVDFADVKGQFEAKRALEIAAAGGHNILLIGPPGSGKTMLAQRIPTILPDLTFDEGLEVTKIHSIAGGLPSGMPMIMQRPFRSPHHTVSAVGLTGGGTNPKPGEISLAHHGVLFLDELPEFRKDALEVLRQPLEDGYVTITRASGTYAYPCNVMMVASMNPCPCGFYGDRTHKCSCTGAQISRYLGKISGPLLDRIDLHIEVPAVAYEDLEQREKSTSSAEMKRRVNQARKIQMQRYQGAGIFSNSQLTPALMEKYCGLGPEENALLKEAFETLGMSARAHNRILKVARTIADLEASRDIQVHHLAEAIQYRSLDRKFWQ